jgi:hypothetical protein
MTRIERPVNLPMQKLFSTFKSTVCLLLLKIYSEGRGETERSCRRSSAAFGDRACTATKTCLLISNFSSYYRVTKQTGALLRKTQFPSVPTYAPPLGHSHLSPHSHHVSAQCLPRPLPSPPARRANPVPNPEIAPIQALVRVLVQRQTRVRGFGVTCARRGGPGKENKEEDKEDGVVCAMVGWGSRWVQ